MTELIDGRGEEWCTRVGRNANRSNYWKILIEIEHYKHFTEVSEVHRLRDSGCNGQSIAQELKISPSTVKRRAALVAANPVEFSLHVNNVDIEDL